MRLRKIRMDYFGFLVDLQDSQGIVFLAYRIVFYASLNQFTVCFDFPMAIQNTARFHVLMNGVPPHPKSEHP